MNVAPRTPSCPTDLALEEHLAHADPGVARHAADCARCRAWLEAAATAGARFHADVAPRLVPRVLAALEAGARGDDLHATARRRVAPSRLRWWLGGLAAAACIAAVSVLVPVHRPDELLAKGAGLTVHLRRGSEVRVAGPSERVEPGDELRFSLAPPRPCHAWVASLDAAGRVSLLVPAGGGEPARVDGPGALPGSAVLDATPGPERVFAVCSPTPRAWAAVEGAVRELARRRPGADGVRTLTQLPFPEDEQATLLLERGAR